MIGCTLSSTCQPGSVERRFEDQSIMLFLQKESVTMCKQSILVVILYVVVIATTTTNAFWNDNPKIHKRSSCSIDRVVIPRIQCRSVLLLRSANDNDTTSKSSRLRESNVNNPNIWVNGDDSYPITSKKSASGSGSSSNISGSGLVAASSSSVSKLASAFLGLQESDQYDAVLTGLCAKILDEVPVDQAVAALQDPMALLQEMNDRNVPASPRSLMALIDATVKTQNAKSMAQVLSLCLRNSAMGTSKAASSGKKITKYGSLQTDIIPLPPTPSAYMTATNANSVIKRGSTTQQTSSSQQQQQQQRMTRAERLKILADVPVDDRGAEVTSAMAVLAVAGGCVFANFFGMDDITPYTNLLTFTAITLATVDNFYDLWQILLRQTQEAAATAAANAAANAAAAATSTTTPTKVATLPLSNPSSPAFQLPDKKDMPLQLGTGQVTGTIIRGLTRLLTVDTERECECEAAALVAAYTLGLPCFAFRPNALEAAVLVAESMKEDDVEKKKLKSKILDPLLSNVGIMKMLVWLMAPVAMESMKHTQLIASDPREARGMLQRLEAKANDLSFLRGPSSSSSNNNINDAAPLIWWLQDEQEQEDLLKWAYAEADLLLRSQKQLVMDVAQRLAGGAATVGDCVAVLENW